ncbi:MAG: hypothetical protein ABSG03_12175 [Bryobacteraceae bacterium]|jgi:hypothetical protein
MIRRVAPLALALCLPLLPKTPLQPVQVVTTDKVDFAAGGTIRFEGSVGELNIEGWDQPQVQVTFTRFDYADATNKDREKGNLERITLKTEKRSGNELVITTTLPHRNYFVRQVRGATNSDMNYRVMVPRDSHLIVHHGNGDVILYDVAGDIEATARTGAIVVQLDDPAQYSIDARSRVGEVYSDYDGKYRTPLHIGESLLGPAPPPAHRVYLRVKIGAIDIVKMAPK